MFCPRCNKEVGFAQECPKCEGHLIDPSEPIQLDKPAKKDTKKKKGKDK